jgi:type I restriction enzyme M protein
MSRKRDVLEHFKRDELLVAVDRFELSVQDRRGKGGLVAALAGSRRAGLAEILGDLPRARLKEICWDMGLDDSGREKAVFVARLAGEAPAARSAAEAAPSSRDKAPVPRAGRAARVAAETAPAGLLTREALGALSLVGRRHPARVDRQQ